MVEETETDQESGPGQDQGQASGSSRQGSDPWADPTAARTEIEKLRSEAASWRTKVRELEPLARKAQEADEAGKSEVQKALERAQVAEARIAELELDGLRVQIGHAAGLTVAQAARLKGSTREELEADAKAFAGELKLGAKGTDLKQGARGESSQKIDGNDWLRRMAKH